jgi:serine/threonine protein kinase
MTAKISDLGVAKIVDRSPLLVSRMTQTPGTPAYMPPEVMIANPTYDASVDEFSYGILMIHVLSGQWPEPQVEPNRVEGNKLVPVSEADRRIKYIEMIGDSHPLMELLLRCISNNPQLRPHSGEIVNQLSELVLKFPADHHQPEKLTVPLSGTLTKSRKGHKKTFPVVKPETESCSGTLRRSRSRKAIDVLSVDKPSSLDRNDSQEEGKMSHTVERQLKGLFGRRQKVSRL